MAFPESLAAKGYLFDKHFRSLQPPWDLAVKRLLYASDYAARHLALIAELLAEDDCQQGLTLPAYQQALRVISSASPYTIFASKLRQFRHRHLLRLMLREYAGLAEISDTIQQWSYCADAIILHAKRYCEQQCVLKYGEPCAELYTIAMGKLGGNELNFSSDIDLIFTFTASGYTSAADAAISHQEFYTKVIQLFLQVLQTNTEDGFVFRVDLRLRPNGESGPLVLSLIAMENYYQEQGRDWERYAMVKARLLEPDPAMQQWFKLWLVPFVYRRYIDYSVIESMKTMKSMIEREILRNAMPDDIKRGVGGIREIEFIIQSLQLIRGGRAPQIQQTNALCALSLLSQAGFISKAAVLKRGYLFLRQLENALQMEQDKQTHALPRDVKSQAAIAVAMGMHDWHEVIDSLQRYQNIVSRLFRAMFHPQEEELQDDKKVMANQLHSVWQGQVEENMAINLLHSLNYTQPQRCYRLLLDFRNTPRCRRLPQSARMRLDRLMGLILKALIDQADTDKVLLQVLRLLENIVGRSAYLALLLENPPVLHEVLHWFLHSPMISHLMVSYPFLLEVFIDQNNTWRLPTMLQLSELLATRLQHASDVEQQDDVLRQFKWMCILLAARAEWYAQYDSVTMSKFLTQVAELIITHVLKMILAASGAELAATKARFAIIAYGSLGSSEMHYHSDVDLVFLHNLPTSKEHLVTRLTQKILHRLTTRTQFGVLYAVDTRLRPSGGAGLLISHVDAYIEYQMHTAWTWEHQALLRARLIYSNDTISRKFIRMKRAILQYQRDKTTLRNEILTMRERISKHKVIDVGKAMPGGLLDLEFLVQYLVLASGSARFYGHTHTLAQIKQLAKLGILDRQTSDHLQHAYCQFQKALHDATLQEKTVHVSTALCQETVAHLMSRLYS